MRNQLNVFVILAEVVEHTCGAASLMMGETLGNLASSLDTYSYKQPLGVCAGICPFNFPAMIPLWMFPVGVVTGNTYVLKPSEKDPGASMVGFLLPLSGRLFANDLLRLYWDTIRFLLVSPKKLVFLMAS